jgi:hypothetical protein
MADLEAQATVSGRETTEQPWQRQWHTLGSSRNKPSRITMRTSRKNTFIFVTINKLKVYVTTDTGQDE